MSAFAWIYASAKHPVRPRRHPDRPAPGHHPLDPVRPGKLGIDEPDLARLEHFIGPPLLQAFMQFYGFDEAKAWEAVNFYRERFKVTGLYENRVFDGVPALLETLSGQGRTLYIATSKPWEFAREIARHFDFDHHFKVIYGSELDGTRTNKVELIAI
jgi:phosphoglycolate phosphatase